MNERLEVDGVPLDDLLPPPTERVKRKEPNQVLDAENQLISGMAMPIQPTNRGYQMMMRMGFKPESEQTELPVIELRRGRGGLGSPVPPRASDTDDACPLPELDAKRRKELENEKDQFHLLVRRQVEQKHLAGQLFAMLKLCYHLRDEKNALLSGARHQGQETLNDDPPPLIADETMRQTYYSPGGARIVRDVLGRMDYETQSLHHQQLYRYLREDFLYCFYCAHSYETRESMTESCPGLTEEAHLNAPAIPRSEALK